MRFEQNAWIQYYDKNLKEACDNLVWDMFGNEKFFDIDIDFKEKFLFNIGSNHINKMWIRNYRKHFLKGVIE